MTAQSNTGGAALTDPIDTDDLRRMLDAATPGPWHIAPNGVYVTDKKLWFDGDGSRHGDTPNMVIDCATPENAALIALSPQLAAENLALRAALFALRAREAEMRAENERLQAIVGRGPTHRHVKRGTLYRLIGTARIQSDEPLTDDAEVEIYHGAHGDLWARRKVEFHDGRFAALSSQPDSGESSA